MRAWIVAAFLLGLVPTTAFSQNVMDTDLAEDLADCAGLYQALSAVVRRDDSALADSYLEASQKTKLGSWIVATEVAGGDAEKGLTFAEETMSSRWRNWFSIMRSQGLTTAAREQAAICDNLRIICSDIINSAQAQ